MEGEYGTLTVIFGSEYGDEEAWSCSRDSVLISLAKLIHNVHATYSNAAERIYKITASG